MSVITLSTVPGFSDLSDTPLTANQLALGTHLSRINVNASFGMVRLEFFTGIYANGDTVPQPTSPVDGYTYSRDELIYMWVPANTANVNTGFASYREPWTMWYGVWNVDQATGLVSSEIGYRGNNDHKDRQATTNDGQLQVFTIAQRQKTGLTMAASPSFTKHVTADFAVDFPLTTGLLTDLNHAAKFGVINTEVVYLGEFFNGQTVPQPVSPIDGHTYAYADCKFQTSWRWTADSDANGNPQKPAISKGQLQDWSASVGPSGLVQIASTAVEYELSGQHLYNTGKVAVFAFCTRAAGTTFATQQIGFAEIADSTFSGGSTLRASTLQQLNNNINQAVCTPEFFGPTTYTNGQTVAIPTSPLDGYVYQRSELTYIWDWANTGPAVDHTARLSLVHGSISAAGVVSVSDYRLSSGASAAALVHEGQMRVLVVAKRANNFGTPPSPTLSAPDIVGDPIVEWLGNLDSIPDGPLSFGRTLLTRLNANRPLIDFTETFHLNRVVAALPGVISDNLIKNGDLDQGSVNWNLPAGVQILTGQAGLPRGAAKMRITSSASGNIVPQTNDLIPIDPAKTYLYECWVNIPVALTGGVTFRPLLAEYDSNGVALPAHVTGGSSFMYQEVLTSTVGNTWQYLATECTGSNATPPTNYVFNSNAKYVKAGVMMVAGTAGQIGEILGMRFSEVAAGHARAIGAIDSGRVIVPGSIDFSRAYTGKHLGNIPDDAGSSRFAVLAVDGNRRAIVDFAQAHVNKSQDNVPSGTVYGRTPLGFADNDGWLPSNGPELVFNADFSLHTPPTGVISSRASAARVDDLSFGGVQQQTPNGFTRNFEITGNGEGVAYRSNVAGFQPGPGQWCMVLQDRGGSTNDCFTEVTDAFSVNPAKKYRIQCTFSPGNGASDAHQAYYFRVFFYKAGATDFSRTSASLCANNPTIENGSNLFNSGVQAGLAKLVEAKTGSVQQTVAATITPPSDAAYARIAVYHWNDGTATTAVWNLLFGGLSFKPLTQDNDAQFFVSTPLNGQGSIVPGQAIVISISYNDTSITLSWSSQSFLRADNTTLTIPSGTQSYTGLTAHTDYYMYGRINSTTGVPSFVNGAPPPTSPSSTLAMQAALDGGFSVPPIHIQTLTTGGTGGSGTGGGGGTCPEENELVEVQDHGWIRAEDVEVGMFIKGYSFAKKQDVFRKVIGKFYQSCCAWRLVDGYRVTPCEPIFYQGQWMPAFKAPGSKFDNLLSYRMEITVLADEDQEHNYWLVGRKTPLLIHNGNILPC